MSYVNQQRLFLCLSLSIASIQIRGMIEIEASLIPAKEADFAPVGKGREEPNRNPYLEPVTENRTYVDWKYVGAAVESATKTIMSSAKYGLIITVRRTIPTCQ